MPGRNERPFRYEWESVMRRLALPAPTKLVAAYCAQYGDLDGRQVRPGEKRLKIETCLGERTVREALATLREIGLLVRVRAGSKMGRRALADEYKLALPENVADKVAEWNVRANRGQLGLVDDGLGADLSRGARNPRRGKHKSPAGDAGDTTRENPSNPDTAREEQRQEPPVITKNTGRRAQRTPAPGAAHHTSDHTSITPTTNTGSPQEQPLTSREPEAEEDPISPPADRTTPLAEVIPITLLDSTSEPRVKNPGSINKRRSRASSHDQHPNDQPRVDNHGAVVEIQFIQPAEPRVSNHGNGRNHCVHGKSSRRNKNGIPRCEDCRAEQVQQIEQAASTVQLGPSRCPDHGLKAGRRDDGKPHCPLCRVMEARTP